MNLPRHDPTDWIEEQLDGLQERGLRRQLATFVGPQTVTAMIDGESLVNFGANDYLGLAADKRLADAAIRATQDEGWGSGASPLVTGHRGSHQQLEQRLAEMEATEAALLFSSGFAANVGTIAALVGSGDVVLGDRKNHASIIDGCRLSRADVKVYPHADVSRVESLLKKARGYRRRLIVTDALFSMDGDFAPLRDLADLAERYDAMLMVDEAHATGVFGEHGRGVSEHLGVEDRVHVRVGTLSKALGCAGGFVVGRKPLIEWLVNRARSYVFSTAPPPATAAAAIAAIDIVKTEPQRRVELLQRAEKLRATFSADGWDVGSSQSQIIPIILGDVDRTMTMAADLRRDGLLVPGIRPPSVPEGHSLLRVSLSFGHTDVMIERLVTALRALR
jgi:8-amino-7-oxononanoate synthase